MSPLLRVAVCLAGITLILLTFKAVVTRKISERQSLFWIFAGVVVIMLAVFPGLTYWVAGIFGVTYAPSLIFTVGIILAMYGIFTCYKTNAILAARIQELSMQVSLLNEENSRLLAPLKSSHDISSLVIPAIEKNREKNMPPEKQEK